MSHVLMELKPDLNVKTSYVYGGHQQLIEEPVAADRSKDLYLLHDGTVGNITHATTRTGATANSYSYEPFGARTPQTVTTASRYGYTGEEYGAETGLVYLRARYYDPTLGRFISPDPFLGRLAEPITQNRYVYVKNNPLGFTDPSGLDGLGTSGNQSCLTVSAIYGLSFCLSSHSDAYQNAFIGYSIDVVKGSGVGIDLSATRVTTNATSIAPLMDDSIATVTVSVVGNVNPLLGITGGQIYSNSYTVVA